LSFTKLQSSLTGSNLLLLHKEPSAVSLNQPPNPSLTSYSITSPPQNQPVLCPKHNHTITTMPSSLTTANQVHQSKNRPPQSLKLTTAHGLTSPNPSPCPYQFNAVGVVTTSSPLYTQSVHSLPSQFINHHPHPHNHSSYHKIIMLRTITTAALQPTNHLFISPPHQIKSPP
jgi:hypothetical protein